MSLRGKYLAAVCASLLLPLLAYLLVETLVIRSWLVRDQADSLRTVADVLHHSLEACRLDCAERHSLILRRFAATHPDVEVVIVDDRSTITAASRPQMVGRSWVEPGIARVLRGESSFEWSTMRHGDEPVLDVTVPWRPDGRTPRGALHLARSLASVYAQVRVMQLRHVAFVVAVVLAASVFLSLFTYRVVIRRLLGLDAELRSIVPSASQPPAAPGDELDRVSATLRHLVADLARVASELAATLREKESLLLEVEGHREKLSREISRVRGELLAAQRDLVQAEHLATMGQLAAGLAHEIRNPLFIIRASAEAIRRRHPAAAEQAEDVIQETDRVETIIARLVDLARPLAVTRQRVSLNAIVRAVVADAERRARASGTELHLSLEETPSVDVDGDAPSLEQAFANLVTNACEATAAKGAVLLRVGYAAPGVPQVEICDTGVGIRAEDLPHIFEPFFTRKAGGMGLGLAAAKKVLELHGASITVESEPGRGTRVIVQFPQLAEEA